MSNGWTVVDAITNKSLPITGKVDSGAVSPYFMPAPGQQDPVGKMRVSQPQALIDTDFEYGQQPTKWESISLQNNRQGCYIIPQQPLTVTALTGAGTQTLTITGTFVVPANSPIYIQNALDPAANGWWLTVAGGTNTITVTTTSTVAVGNQFNAALTYVYLGYFYSGCGILLNSTTAFTNSGTTVTCTTAAPHGLSSGSLIYVLGTTASTNAPNGSWVVASTPTANTFTFVVNTAPTGTINNTANNTTLFARPAGYVESRSFDGGVAFSAGAAVPNSQLIRQTRRYFRYQSGKAIQFSTGTSLCPPLFVTSLTSVGATATVTTRFPHNIAVGCDIVVEGANQGPYNGTFTVATVPTPTTFTYTMRSAPGVSPATGQIFRVNPLNWYGSSNRVGFFDQQNGVFFEYDGQQLFAVWRSSTLQISGIVQVTQGSATVTGSNTLFSSQLAPGDFIVIRGQSYRVVTIASDTQLFISPEYRGATLTQGGALVSRTVDVRVPRSQWLDPLDGTGPSGYTLDLTKMQMFYIDYSWYGAGYIRWGLRTSKGQITYVYQQNNNNLRFEAYMRSGNLPAHYESNGITANTTLQASLSNTTTTLTAAITSSDTTLTVASAAVLNSFGVIQIGSEQIYYGAVSGTTLLNCVRGFNNTVAALAANGATVTPGSILVNNAGTFGPSGTVRVQAAGATGAVEHIAYTGKTGNLFYGLTRAQTGGALAAQAFTFSATAPINVELAVPDTVASLSHWGSSVIMDGNFDDDKSLVFNFGTTSAISINAGTTVPVLAIRVAPSVDNGTTGLLGVKEIINRSQLQLVDMAAVASGAVLINLVLNGTCTGFSGAFGSIASGTQITSSFAQVAVNTSNSATIAGGESVTALYANGVQQIDLGQVRDLGNSILGGGTSNAVPTGPAGLYPDGPDILYIVATNTTASAVTLLARVNWKESQA